MFDFSWSVGRITARAGIQAVAGLRFVPLLLDLHVGPDLSLASCMVWDETLESQGRGAGVAPVERMEPNYRPVCHLLWEKWREGGSRQGGLEQGRGWEAATLPGALKATLLHGSLGSPSLRGPSLSLAKVAALAVLPPWAQQLTESLGWEPHGLATQVLQYLTIPPPTAT